MKYKTYVRERKWLNPVDSNDSGAIQFYVEDDYEDEVYASLSVWDCGRKATLDFSFCAHDAKSVKERADKITCLIDSLIKMRDAMGKAYDDKAKGVTGGQKEDY